MNKVIKSISTLIFMLLLSRDVSGVEYLKKVTVLPVSNDTIKLEITAAFHYGSVSDCPEMVYFDTVHIGNSLTLKVYYDVSGVWAANFCTITDTVTIGVLTSNFKKIEVEMHNIMHLPADSDTTFNTPPWIIWLPLTVKEVYANESLTISPNPNNGQFVLHGNINGVLRLDIVDMTGRVVYTDDAGIQAVTFRKEIDISDASPGLYMLRLYTGKGILMRKLVIE